MLKLVQDASACAEQAPTTVGLDELCRLAAQEMLKVALLAERQAYLAAHADLIDETGKRLVVGNGYAKEREVTTGAGHGRSESPQGRRPPPRPALPLGDLACLHAQVPQVRIPVILDTCSG